MSPQHKAVTGIMRRASELGPADPASPSQRYAADARGVVRARSANNPPPPGIDVTGLVYKAAQRLARGEAPSAVAADILQAIPPL